MERDLLERVSWVHKAEDRLRATTPHTAEWRNAQRDTVRARADYWAASNELWDVNHLHEAELRRPRRPA
jgi:hypothetical protein